MRGLTSTQRQLIIDFYDEWKPRISISAIEKDILVRDAILAIKDAGRREGCQLIFCGGTALSQAHQFIERMSEDADFRVVVPDGLSNGQTRKLLSVVKEEIATLLNDAGFPLVGKMRARNNNFYFMGEFAYQSRFSDGDPAIRDHLKLEVTAFAPISAVSELQLDTIIERVTSTTSTNAAILTISVMDTLADKTVGYLRRSAQERAGLTRGNYDVRQVRHLYDMHCVFSRLEQLTDFDYCAFSGRLGELVGTVVERDLASYGNQFKEFAEDAYGVLQDELTHLGDNEVRSRYERFCQSMIWGETPNFDEVVTTFGDLARSALGGEPTVTNEHDVASGVE